MTFEVSKLELFPTNPGVYIMKSSTGDILYVGKANNLRQRIKQYFSPGRDNRPIIPLLIAKIYDIEVVIVTSEKEALLLENNLIKKHQPTYNALLKDDKTYIALKINHKHKWPLVQLVRYKGKPEANGLYFGPYTSALAARATLELIHRIFPLRECSDQELARRTRPCILYDMKRCIAPCVGKCTKDEYDILVEKTIRFLRGQDREIIQDLYKEMDRLSENLEFEKAALILKTIKQIESTLEGQKVDRPLGGDFDCLAIYRQGLEATLSKLLFRNGKLLSAFQYNFSESAEDDEELLISFILQHYLQLEELPHEILLPVEIGVKEEISEILSTDKPRKVQIHSPKKGEKKALIEMAYLNAEGYFKQQRDLEKIREKTLLEMQEKLHLNNYPAKIECFDNSNISGTEPVSALVTFFEGKKDKSGYRKYKVRTVSSPDDYSTMYEVLMRRYKRLKEENSLPDLVVIDGGKGHLNIGLKVFQELNVITVDVISVAKEMGRHDKGLTSEQVFLPNHKDPIFLKYNSPILFLLQQIRDEAHRFALSFHKQRRSKKILQSSLLDIPGIGPTKAKALLKHFGSLQNIQIASQEDLAKLKILSQKNIEDIIRELKKGS